MPTEEVERLEAEYGRLMWQAKVIAAKIQACEQRLIEETNRLSKPPETPEEK